MQILRHKLLRQTSLDPGEKKRLYRSLDTNRLQLIALAKLTTRDTDILLSTL